MVAKAGGGSVDSVSSFQLQFQKSYSFTCGEPAKKESPRSTL